MALHECHNQLIKNANTYQLPRYARGVATAMKIRKMRHRLWSHQPRLFQRDISQNKHGRARRSISGSLNDRETQLPSACGLSKF